MRFREITKTEKSKHKVQVSIVIPAYNEEERLPIMMDSMLDFLNNHAFSVEIIIVNDASSDCTSKVALEYHRNWKHKYAIRVLEHVVNLGKGGAIRTVHINHLRISHNIYIFDVGRDGGDRNVYADGGCGWCHEF